MPGGQATNAAQSRSTCSRCCPSPLRLLLLLPVQQLRLLLLLLLVLLLPLLPLLVLLLQLRHRAWRPAQCSGAVVRVLLRCSLLLLHGRLLLKL